MKTTLVTVAILFVAVMAFASPQEADTTQASRTSAQVVSDSFLRADEPPELTTNTTNNNQNIVNRKGSGFSGYWDWVLKIGMGFVLTLLGQFGWYKIKTAEAPKANFAKAMAERQVAACSEAFVRILEVKGIWEDNEPYDAQDFFSRNHKWFVSNWMFLPKKIKVNWNIIKRLVDDINIYLHQLGQEQTPQRTPEEISEFRDQIHYLLNESYNLLEEKFGKS